MGLSLACRLRVEYSNDLEIRIPQEGTPAVESKDFSCAFKCEVNIDETAEPFTFCAVKCEPEVGEIYHSSRNNLKNLK